MEDNGFLNERSFTKESSGFKSRSVHSRRLMFNGLVFSEKSCFSTMKYY
jgi:hypothetical protein